MTIDELVKRTTIDFKRRFIRSEAEDMLKQLSMKIGGGARIAYSVKYFNGFNNGEEDRGSFEISGMISIIGKAIGEPFSFITSSFRDSCVVSGLQFQIIPGYDSLAEYKPETLALWDETRRAVAEYIAEIPPLL